MIEIDMPAKKRGRPRKEDVKSASNLKLEKTRLERSFESIDELVKDFQDELKGMDQRLVPIKRSTRFVLLLQESLDKAKAAYKKERHQKVRLSLFTEELDLKDVV